MKKFLAKLFGITYKHIEIPDDILNVTEVKEIFLEDRYRIEKVGSVVEFSLDQQHQLREISGVDLIHMTYKRAAEEIISEIINKGLISTTTVVEPKTFNKKMYFRLDILVPLDKNNEKMK